MRIQQDGTCIQTVGVADIDSAHLLSAVNQNLYEVRKNSLKKINLIKNMKYLIS